MIARQSQQPLIALIGGAGYIGSLLTRRLLGEGFPVQVFDNYLYGSDGLQGLKHPNLQVIEGDIRNTTDVAHAIRGAEVVVLLAAIVGRRSEDIEWASRRDVNFTASSVVLDAAREHGANRFIFASSESVYGNQSGIMYETGIPEPISAYSRLKLRMEERVLNARTRDFHPTVLRLATCYGYSPRMRFDLVANGMVRDAIYKKQIIVNSPEQCRAFIHVLDAVEAFVSCINAHANLISAETFNVGSSEQSYSMGHIANLIKSRIRETEIDFLDEEPDLADYYLSSSKIEKVLDFKPKHTLEESIEEIKTRILEGEFLDPYSFKYRNT